MGWQGWACCYKTQKRFSTRKKEKNLVLTKHRYIVFGPVFCPLAVAVIGMLKGVGAVAVGVEGEVVVVVGDEGGRQHC